MKKIIIAFAAMLVAVAPQASAKNILTDIFGNKGGAIQNMVEGVFSKSNITVADIVGEYQATGPAVSFKSDNFLKKAGGAAAAGVVESKLNPYYERYGLNNMTFIVNQDSTFTLKIKGMPLSGTISRNDAEGIFVLNFKAFKAIKLGSMNAYITKSGDNIDLMFDITKLKEVASKLTKVFNSQMIKTVGSILDGYDGLCLGYKMNCTKKPAITPTTDSNNNTSSSPGWDLLKGKTGTKK